MTTALHSALRHCWPFGVAAPDTDLSELTGIVTGATAGLGLAVAEQLIKLNLSTLVIGCRNLTKGKAVREKLLQLAPNKDQCTIHVWELDLSSFDSVINFHKQCQQLENIHIFISNAGMVPSLEWTTTKDGWEETLQVNALSTGLLAHLVLAEMAKTADAPKARFKPHLVFVSSTGHYGAKFAQQDAQKILPAINDISTYSSNSFIRRMELYNLSKLLVVQIAKELAILPAASNVVVNSCCPGFCKSSIFDGQNYSWPVKYLLNAVAWSSDYGGRLITWCAVNDTSPGAYVEDGKEVEPSPLLKTEKGEEAMNKVWHELLKLWIKQDPDVRLLEASAQ